MRLLTSASTSNSSIVTGTVITALAIQNVTHWENDDE